MKKWLVMTAGALILGIGVGLVILGIKSKRLELINPWGGKKEKQREMKVVGFLPTWMIGKTIEYKGEIDDLIFLGIEVSEKGELVWDVQGKKINNETYLKMKQSVKNAGGRNILGIKLFEDKKLNKLMRDEEARKKLIEEVKRVVVAGNYDGVNVDFEFQGDPFAVLSDDFIEFLGQFKGAGVGEVSLDVFANTIIKGSTERINKLLTVIDEVIVMAYDFHRPGMDFAGPVAPIGSPANERNISEVVDRITVGNLDRSKIVLAYPLYGYEWKTVNEEFGSQIVRGWYQMVSWKRAKELIRDSTYKIAAGGFFKDNFDEVSMTPWMVWKEQVQKSKIKYQKVKGKTKKITEYYTEDEVHQVYYENEKSLEAKLQLAKEAGVGGVGFWALGYEGEDKKVWEMIKGM